MAKETMRTKTFKHVLALLVALPGAVTTFSSIDEAVGTEADVATGETLYMMCPTSWMAGKSVALEDKSGNTIDFF